MKTNHGFTLVELLVTVALATVLLTVAVPGFRGLVQNNRATAQSHELLTAFTLARSEAVKRGLKVSVCPRDPSDPDQCAGSTDWSTGWIVFTDQQGTDGTVDGASGDEIIRVWEPPKGNPSLSNAESANYIQFQHSGMAETDGTFPVALVLTLPDCTGEQGRSINVALTGRASVSKWMCY